MQEARVQFLVREPRFCMPSAVKRKKKKIHKHMIRVVINLVSKHKLFTAEKNQHLYKYNSFKILEPVNSQFTLLPRQIICPHTS